MKLNYNIYLVLLPLFRTLSCDESEEPMDQDEAK